jgi:gluconolactonase
MIFPTSALEVFASGLDHPEGVLVGADGAIYAGGEAGQIYRIDPLSRQAEVIATTGGFCLGLTQDRNENIYICDCKLGALFRLERDGSCRRFAEPFVTPNFAVFDSNGALYLSDSGDWGKDNGKLFRIAPSGVIEVFHPGPLAFANGLALDAAEQFLYVVESTRHRVLRVPLHGSTEPEIFVDGLARVPDGLAFDALGRLYVTCYATDKLYRCDHMGEKQILCADPDATLLNRPTNCAFLGSSLLISNLGGDHLTLLDLACAGMPLYHQRQASQAAAHSVA